MRFGTILEREKHPVDKLGGELHQRGGLRTHLWENKDTDGDPIVESVHNITKEEFIKDLKRYVWEVKI